VSTQPKRFLTPEEYLEIEYMAQYKSEYFAGEMFGMTSATSNESLLAVQTSYHLSTQLMARPCFVYGSDMRILVKETGLYTYANVVVAPDPSQLEGSHNHTLLNPTLIVEVLSPTTEAYDRGLKFEHYRTIPSFKQYLLISSDRVHADVFTHGDEGLWILTSASKPDDVLRLTSVDCTIRLGDLYVRTSLLDSPADPAAA
jgi:Uma2 family endonuclease